MNLKKTLEDQLRDRVENPQNYRVFSHNKITSNKIEKIIDAILTMPDKLLSEEGKDIKCLFKNLID